MPKYLLIVVSLVLFFILILVTLRYYTSYPETWFGTENPPYVSWFDIRSGKWGNFIKKTTEPSFFNGRYIVNNFDKNDEGWAEKYGHDGIVINNKELKILKELGLNSRPYVWGKMFVTKMSGIEIVIIPQIWITKNKALRVIPYLISENDRINPEFINTSDKHLIFPILNYKDQETCIFYININKEYCNWWRLNSIFININKQIWNLTNKIPILIQTYPIIPVKMKFY